MPLIIYLAVIASLLITIADWIFINWVGLLVIIGSIVAGAAILQLGAAELSLFIRRRRDKNRVMLEIGMTPWLQLLRVVENHKITGVVYQGIYKGHTVESMNFTDLLRLRAELRMHDPSSVSLIDIYLDENHRHWRRSRRANSDQARRGPRADPTPVNEEQALAILGLPQGSSREAINAKFKKLIQRNHPDRDGSDVLSKLINRARDILLS